MGQKIQNTPFSNDNDRQISKKLFHWGVMMWYIVFYDFNKRLYGSYTYRNRVDALQVRDHLKKFLRGNVLMVTADMKLRDFFIMGARWGCGM